MTGRLLQAGDLGEAVSIDAPSPDVVPSFQYTASNSDGNTYANMQPMMPGSSNAVSPAQDEAIVPEATSPAVQTSQAADGDTAIDISIAEPVAVDPVPPATNVPAADSWDNARACAAAPNATNAVLDNSGRLWGWETGVSCACKTAPTPIYTSETAPECGPTGGSAELVQDSMGRFWGYENGHSCVVKVSAQFLKTMTAMADQG